MSKDFFFFKIQWLILSLMMVSSAVRAENIAVAASDWEGFAQRDGTGIYYLLLKQIYAEDSLKFDTSTFQYATNLFRHNKADIMVAVYKQELPDAIYPKWILDTDLPVTGYYLNKQFKSPPNMNSKEIVAGWMKGYAFKQFFPLVKHVYEMDSRSVGFRMLYRERIDVFLDYEENNRDQDFNKLTIFEASPGGYLYMAFQSSDKGRRLAEKYDRMMPKLREDGTLKKLFGRGYQRSGLANFDAK